VTHTSSYIEGESWTYDQYNRVVTHTDLNGNTAWEVYADAPQWLNGTQGPDPSRLLAEYRYGGSFVPPDPGLQVRPYETDWQERTAYVYDDGTSDPDPAVRSTLSGTGATALSSAEKVGLGRVPEVQEWTRTKNPDGTYAVAMSDFTHTTYDAITGQPTSITSSEGVINYTYDPVTGRKVRMWTGTDSANAPDDTAYSYDTQGRLTDVYTLALDGTRYATFNTIDPTTHNPTFTGGVPPDTNYTYWPAGNLLGEKASDGTGARPRQSKTRSPCVWEHKGMGNATFTCSDISVEPSWDWASCVMSHSTAIMAKQAGCGLASVKARRVRASAARFRGKGDLQRVAADLRDVLVSIHAPRRVAMTVVTSAS
jgi:hypothetical protein